MKSPNFPSLPWAGENRALLLAIIIIIHLYYSIESDFPSPLLANCPKTESYFTECQFVHQWQTAQNWALQHTEPPFPHSATGQLVKNKAY